MSKLFREYYATSPSPHLLQTDHENHLLTIFITWIDAVSKYLSVCSSYPAVRAANASISSFLKFSNFFTVIFSFQNAGIGRRPTWRIFESAVMNGREIPKSCPKLHSLRAQPKEWSISGSWIPAVMTCHIHFLTTGSSNFKVVGQVFILRSLPDNIFEAHWLRTSEAGLYIMLSTNFSGQYRSVPILWLPIAELLSLPHMTELRRLITRTQERDLSPLEY